MTYTTHSLLIHHHASTVSLLFLYYSSRPIAEDHWEHNDRTTKNRKRNHGLQHVVFHDSDAKILIFRLLDK